jgi:hypothetical protein
MKKTFIELLLLGVLLYAGWWTYTTWLHHDGPATAQQSQVPVISIAGQHDVRGAPTLSADQVNAILARAGSPATGTGDTFYQESLDTGINDTWPLAFFQHESNKGLKGWAVVNRSIGNIRCSAGYSCNGGYRSYATWQAGIADWYALIKNLYINQWGLVTVEQIIPKYAPTYDHNDESAYIASVINTVQSWQ